ncbi:hypothetical protein SSX86_023929 [Deinandra increscens subsp. villosa]|uniref:40S ribosomal protein S29 n=1 Tax=Deinandra increscens subsp. villosa TaxID=3103831 RepID=A0AAP0CLV8_9ASTR
MGHSNIWNSHPKLYGPGSRTCRVCGNSHGLIRKYGLMCCRQCFHSNAKEIGFIKSEDILAVGGERRNMTTIDILVVGGERRK